jgi:hypothetical protein
MPQVSNDCRGVEAIVSNEADAMRKPRIAGRFIRGIYLPTISALATLGDTSHGSFVVCLVVRFQLRSGVRPYRMASQVN